MIIQFVATTGHKIRAVGVVSQNFFSSVVALPAAVRGGDRTAKDRGTVDYQ
jgi:hypothetical protein